MYCVVKLKEFQRPILASLAGKKNSRYLTSSYILYLSGQLTMAYLGTAFYPGGVFAFWPFADSFVSIAEYSYLVMRTASKEFRPSTFWIKFIHSFRFLSFIALILHAIYFLSCDSCGVPILSKLLKLQAAYNLILIIASIYNFVTLSSTGKSNNASHARLLVDGKNGYRNGFKNNHSNGVRVKTYGDQNNNPKRG